MNTGALLYWIVLFIVSLLVVWLVLYLILAWFAPSFYNGDGSVNWGTTLWVSAVLIVFVWIVLLILGWLFTWMNSGSNCDTCGHNNSMNVFV